MVYKIKYYYAHTTERHNFIIIMVITVCEFVTREQ